MVEAVWETDSTPIPAREEFFVPMSFVIRGGTVYDGDGTPGRAADVAVDADRVLAVGEVPLGSDARAIDATGLAVAPGFINVLSHAWGSLQTQPRGPSDILQGVTTEVFGEGYSLGPSTPEVVHALSRSHLRENERADFERLSEGLGYLASSGVAPNVASFVGAHNLRIIGGGLSAGPLCREALDRVRGVLEEEMVDGALGIGTALIYAPGSFADTDELIALSEVVARYDGLYISHMRSEGERLLESLDEVLEIGRRSGVRTEVWHLKAGGRHNWPNMKPAVELIQKARDEGREFGANMYPYTAGGTRLSSTIPLRFHDGGPDALVARLADPDTCQQIAEEIRQASGAREDLSLEPGAGNSILLTGGSHSNERLDGRWLGDVAVERGLDEVAAVLEIVREDPRMSAMFFLIDEENVRLGLRQPWVSIGSDAPALTVEPPWTDQRVHPRAYGTFSRFLGTYSRDLGLVTLEDAIRRMTSMAADRFRLRGRGRLTPGTFADIVVFDPDAITDHATYEMPHAYATGVRHVLVNGEPVVLDGAITAALPGRHLRRGV